MRRYLGNQRQLAGIRRFILDDDRGRGMRVFEVNNGSGLMFNVYPDRGLDIGEVFFNGRQLAWLTGSSAAAPAFYSTEGNEWLRSWGGGLLTGCGLMNVGGPNHAGGENHGLHGRLSHTPAGQVNSSSRWNSEGIYELKVDGDIRVSRVFGKNLLMNRSIRTAMGDNSIEIEDTVCNEGFRTTPFMLLYHMNFGFPLLNENCYLEAAEHKVTPQNAIAAAGFRDWNSAEPPTEDFIEQVFYHEIPADENGMASISMINPDNRLKLTVSYRTAELPYLAQWKMMGLGEYVMGLEPANCFPEGQENFEKRGLLKMLAPGETVSTKVRVSIEELNA
jgi:hypothetical protein